MTPLDRSLTKPVTSASRFCGHSRAAGATTTPCGLQTGENGTTFIEIIQQCNENLRDPEAGKWGLTCQTLGFGSEGSMDCFEASISPDGSCMADMSSCVP